LSLDNCFIEILGGSVAQVPVIPGRGVTDRSFLVLFDSKEHESQAHVAGKTFREFVLAKATRKLRCPPSHQRPSCDSSLSSVTHQSASPDLRARRGAVLEQ